MTTTNSTGGTASGVDRLMQVIGVVALLVAGVFPFAATGLLAPAWAVVAAWVAWAGTAVLTWYVGRRRPRLTPLVPLAAALAWYLFVAAAASAFSWSP